MAESIASLFYVPRCLTLHKYCKGAFSFLTLEIYHHHHPQKKERRKEDNDDENEVFVAIK